MADSADSVSNTRNHISTQITQDRGVLLAVHSCGYIRRSPTSCHQKSKPSAPTPVHPPSLRLHLNDHAISCCGRPHAQRLPSTTTHPRPALGIASRLPRSPRPPPRHRPSPPPPLLEVKPFSSYSKHTALEAVCSRRLEMHGSCSALSLLVGNSNNILRTEFGSELIAGLEEQMLPCGHSRAARRVDASDKILASSRLPRRGQR